MKYSSLILVAICSVAFVVQLLYQPFTDDFVLVSKEAASRPWTLLTAIFLHGDYSHLFYNMLALVMFGLILENIIGSKKFLAVFFAAGLFANIASLFFYESVLGASGAIFGIIGMLVAIRPKMIAFALGVPMPMIVAAALWAILDIAGVFYPTNVANMAHLAGLWIGLALGLLMRKSFAGPQKKKEKIVPEKEIDEWEKEWMK